MPEHRLTPDIAPEAKAFALELLDRCKFPDSGGPFVCAVSGGADSLALLILASTSGFVTTAVHIDHGLREGSATEAEVVRQAAITLGCSFRSEQVVVAPGADLEARARSARHLALRQAADGAIVFTGHTQDDQAETLLINLLRGSGVAGLAAMRPGGTHPILGLRRTETVELCRLAGFEAVQDPSNNDPRFVRNRVRHELLPLMKQISGRDIAPLLSRTSDRARQMQDTITSLAASLDPTDTRSLQAAEPAMAAEALRQWLKDEAGHPPSAAELDRVLGVVNHQAVSCQLTRGRQVLRTNGQLRIEETGAS